MTPVLLLQVMPRLSLERAAQYAPLIDAAWAEADITTLPRQAAWLAQVAHESGELRWWTELATGEAYEGRKDLGNVQPGDGPRYKGRGPIQLTGRANYRAAGAALELDLEGHPELAATPEVGFRVACWFWTTHNLNRLADLNDFRAITRVINGGYNGERDREAYYTRALVSLAMR